MRGGHSAFAGPNVPGSEAQTTPRLGVDSKHGVKQHTVAMSLTHFPKAPPTIIRCTDTDIARVLYGQDMPPCRGSERWLTPTFDDPADSNTVVSNKTIKLYLNTSDTIRHTSQTTATGVNHPFEKYRPPLSRRASPNLPNIISMQHSIS